MKTKKTQPQANEAVLFVRGLNPKMKSKFKAICALQDISMSQQVQKMMKEFITNKRK